MESMREELIGKFYPYADILSSVGLQGNHSNGTLPEVLQTAFEWQQATIEEPLEYKRNFQFVRPPVLAILDICAPVFDYSKSKIGFLVFLPSVLL